MSEDGAAKGQFSLSVSEVYAGPTDADDPHATSRIPLPIGGTVHTFEDDRCLVTITIPMAFGPGHWSGFEGPPRTPLPTEQRALRVALVELLGPSFRLLPESE